MNIERERLTSVPFYMQPPRQYEAALDLKPERQP
jgi:hypothetical protein